MTSVLWDAEWLGSSVVWSSEESNRGAGWSRRRLWNMPKAQEEDAPPIELSVVDEQLPVEVVAPGATLLPKVEKPRKPTAAELTAAAIEKAKAQAFDDFKVEFKAWADAQREEAKQQKAAERAERERERLEAAKDQEAKQIERQAQEAERARRKAMEDEETVIGDLLSKRNAAARKIIFDGYQRLSKLLKL